MEKVAKLLKIVAIGVIIYIVISISYSEGQAKSYSVCEASYEQTIKSLVNMNTMAEMRWAAELDKCENDLAKCRRKK